jgi:hypothetical protein
MNFVVLPRMFLTLPTIHELQALDLPVLIDMLVQQTAIYTKMLTKRGFSGPTETCKELIVNIQAAIEAKRNENKPGKNAGSMGVSPDLPAKK